MTLEKRILSVVVLLEGEAIFDESATTISIADDAGGEFVTVSQCRDDYTGKIAINPEYWTDLRAAIDEMVKECRS